MEYQQRTIAQVIRTYRDQLTNATYETLNGRTDAIGMGRAHRDMIWKLGPDAYMEGLREGGVPSEELDATDRKAITDWLNSQMAHVSKFASDTVAARGDDGKRKQILSRLDMWVESMRAIGSQGLMSAKKNKMGTWRLGGTIEHCTTCSGLHKKRHRLSWYTSRGLIPRQPGSQTLECKGYLCQCYITDDEGNVIVPATGRALRFDPNQPRDPEGKWTISAGSGSGKANIIKDFAKKNGIDQNKIRVVNSKKLTSDGYSIMADYDRETGIISIYKNAPNDPNILNGVLAHEYIHSITEKISNPDLAKIIKDIAGNDAWNALGWRAFEKSAGFTEFSSYIWTTESGNLAFKETLCEVARMNMIGKSSSVPTDWQAAYKRLMETQ